MGGGAAGIGEWVVSGKVRQWDFARARLEIERRTGKALVSGQDRGAGQPGAQRRGPAGPRRVGMILRFLDPKYVDSSSYKW